MRRSLLAVAGFPFVLGVVPRAQADVPRTIPFQAQVSVASGEPVTVATSFTFSLYDAATGGTALWNETQTLTPVGGSVSAILGSVTPLPSSLDRPLFIGIAVGADAEMTPRVALASVPYALTIANGSVTDAKITDVAWKKVTDAPAGFPPTGAAGGDLAGSYPNPELASKETSLAKVSGGTLTAASGKVGLGNATPGFPLNFAPALGDKISLWGNAGAHYGFGVQSGQLQVHADIANSDVVFGYGTSAALTETMRIRGTGNVGIGTKTPASKLTVAGVIQSTTGGVKFPDNTVQLTAGMVPGAAAGGDLTGTYPDPTIGAGKVTDDKIASVAWGKVTGAPAIPTTLPPSGPAGGDLAGTYPDPTIAAGKVTDAKIADVAWTKVTGAPTSMAPSGPAGGDLAGAYPDPTIGAGKVDNTKLASDIASLNKVSGGRMTATATNVGIGTATPGFPLSFGNALGDKIGLWGITGNHYGIGVQSGQLQIHTDGSGSDVVFGYGTSAAMTETMRIEGTGNVGIGVSSTEAQLTVKPDSGGRWLSLWSATGPSWHVSSMGGTGLNFGEAYLPNGRLFLKNGGNIGIGTTSPGFPLNFTNTVGDKISLYGNSGDHYGFGIQNNLLQIHSGAAASDIAFGYGQSGAMTETMRIKGNGNVGIGTSAPQSTLTVAGTVGVEDRLGVGLTSLIGGKLHVRTHTVASSAIDQQQTQHNFGVGTTSIWQSFTPAIGGHLVRFDLLPFDSFGGILVIREGEGTAGPVIAQQSIEAQADAWSSVDIGDMPFLTAGVRYTWQAISDTESLADVYIQQSDVYAGGRSSMNPAWDYCFRTWMGSPGPDRNAFFVNGANGNVGIGTSAPAYTLDVQGTARITNVPVGDRRALQWDPDSGQIYRLTSSRRYKENIKPLSDDFQKLLMAEPKSYTFIGSPEHSEIGYIAEELDALGLKPLVEYDREGRPDALKYEMMVLYLAEIAKGQKSEIAALRAENARLAVKDAELEDRLSRLEKLVGAGRR